jgi:SAM-dependent methyltransferase
MMVSNLAGISALAEETVKLNPGDIVLDIGCNDGTLLASYQTQGLRHIGIDPSDVALKARERGFEVVNDFYSADAFRRVHPQEKARVVTSISMFYDLESPRAFVEDIASVLADDGIWILEQSYLPSMLAVNSFDTICHEHLEYYSLAVLERLFGECGLEVVDVHLNDVNGGSFRLCVAHQGRVKPSREAAIRVQELRVSEFELALDTDTPYAEFRANIRRIKNELQAFLKKAKAEGKLVHGYGASTKGNTTLQYCGINGDILPAIADRNPRKWGSFTIGSRVKIISEDESRAAKPDYYLVLPWHFMPEFKTREKEFLARGGQFVVPFPQVHLVS